MNWPFLFIPAVLCLALILFSGFCAVVAALALRRVKRIAFLKELASKPPILGAGNQSAVARLPWFVLIKGILGMGLVGVVTGLAGLWATGLSIGLAQNSPVEWSDGRAPELEPLIGKHCMPFVREGKSIGMAVAVVTPTRATVMSFGRPSLLSTVQTRSDTLYEIGSITKTFTGLALARTIERGTVRLDQPIQELLPMGVTLPEPARAITLRHLVSHASGLPRVSPNSSLGPAIRMMLLGSDPYAGYTRDALLADVGTVKLDFEPGTKCSYSNLGMTLLGHLLATKAKSSYEALIQREICEPLEMRDTRITLQPGQVARFAQGYRAVLRVGPFVLGLRSVPWFENNDLGGAGALRSTGADMLKYLQAHMRPEPALEHAVGETHRELAKEGEQMAHGMAWVLTQDQTLKQTVIWHNGGTGGFRSFLGFAERSGVGVLILSNTSESVDDLSLDLLRDLAASPSHTTE